MKIKFFVWAQDFPKEEVTLDVPDEVVFDQEFMSYFCLEQAKATYGSGWDTKKYDVEYGFEIIDERYLDYLKNADWTEVSDDPSV